jgi:[ribosomal protein S5]-alanine N-acetyltransferase
MNFPENIPALETGRLVLRALKDEDADKIFLLRSDETINKYVDRPRAITVEDAKAFIRKIELFTAEKKGLYWAIAIKGKEKLIGTIALWNFDLQQNKAELGYELLTEYQGQGYMQEALRTVIGYAFKQLGLSSIEGWTHPDNISSSKLLGKLGFIRDHEAEKTKPAEANEIIYSLSPGNHS